MRRSDVLASVETGYYDRFFAPLVGSEESIAGFKFGLTDGEALSSHSDPYEELATRTKGVASLAIEDWCREETDDKVISKIWSSIEANAHFGVDIALASLRAVGSIYAKDVKNPQIKENVSASVTKALGLSYGMAFSGPLIGSINLHAFQKGYNPRGYLALPRTLFSLLAERKPRSPDFTPGFAAVINGNGQISVSPRYNRRLGSANDRQCPASYSPVEQADKTPRHLWRFLKALGDVAMSEIYPQQFPITSAP